MGQAWDVVIVVTGGTVVPAVPGAHLVHDTWDLLAGAKRMQGHVAVYDDHGGNQALDAAEALVRGGATVEIITPERTVSPDVGSLTALGYFHSMAQSGTTVTVLRRLLAVTKGAEGLDDHPRCGRDRLPRGARLRRRRRRDGHEPVRELYDELISSSTNLGAVDLSDLLALRPQSTRAQRRRAVPDLPHRRCGGQPQCTRGDARRCAAVSRDLRAVDARGSLPCLNVSQSSCLGARRE